MSSFICASSLVGSMLDRRRLLKRLGKFGTGEQGKGPGRVPTSIDCVTAVVPLGFLGSVYLGPPVLPFSHPFLVGRAPLLK